MIGCWLSSLRIDALGVGTDYAFWQGRVEHGFAPDMNLSRRPARALHPGELRLAQTGSPGLWLMSAGAPRPTAYMSFPDERRSTWKRALHDSTCGDPNVRAPEAAGAGLHAFWQVHVGRRPAADGLHELCSSEPENAQSPSARGRRSWAPRILASSCRPAAHGRRPT